MTALNKLLRAIDDSIEFHTGGEELKSLHECVSDDHIVRELKKIKNVYKMATRRKINWYETPKTVSLTNDQLARVLQDQDRFFDTFPNAWNTDWNSQLSTEAEVYNDEGITFLRAKRRSSNSWRVQTTFS